MSLFFAKFCLTEDVLQNTNTEILRFNMLWLFTNYYNCLVNLIGQFAKKTKHTLQSNSNILRASLADSDLFARMASLLIAVAVKVKRAFSSEPFCALETAHFITLYGPTYVSLVHLTLIVIDRYIAIKDALWHQVSVKKTAD